MVTSSPAPAPRPDTGVKAFLRDYKSPILWAVDAKLAYLTFLAALVVLAESPAARDRLNDLASSGISITALGLTFVLASMSLISGMLDINVVNALDKMEHDRGRAYGLHGLVMAFRATAVIAAAGVLAWMTVRGVATSHLVHKGWGTARVVSGSAAVALTVWVVVGIVQLIGIVGTLVDGKATLLRQRARREQIGPGSGERSA